MKNDLKQFFGTKTGKIVGIVAILFIGILIGTSGSKKENSSEQTVTSTQQPVQEPVTQNPAPEEKPASVPVKPVSTKTSTASSLKTVPTPTDTNTSNQNNVSAPVPPPAPVAAWHTAYTLSGSTADLQDYKTPTFALRGSQQRIDYKCSIFDQTNPYGGSLGAGIKATQGYSGDRFVPSASCPVDADTYEYSLDPGQYYLEIDYRNASYTITVEDYY